MNFVYPAFLFALIIIAVPIIIHLFNFKRFKKVFFTNVLFLKEVKKETTSRSKLKHLLVLFSRILAMTFLIFAFAQPYLPKGNMFDNKGKRIISIWLDNSFSMSAKINDIAVIDKAKQTAKEIVNAYNNGEKFNLITNNLNTAHQSSITSDEIISLIDEVKVNPNVATVSDVIDRQKQLISDEDGISYIISYLISDFQKNITDVDKIDEDTSIILNFVPLQSTSTANIYIDSVWFYGPNRYINQSNKLIVRLKNTSDELVENSRITLKLNEKTKAIGDISIPPKTWITDTLSFVINTTGFYNAELSLTDYPISFDDTYFFTFSLAEEISILSVNEKEANMYIEALFSEDPYFNLINANIGQLNYANFPLYELIILNGIKTLSSGLSHELVKYVERGGNLLLFPNQDMDINSVNKLLKMMGTHSYSGMVDDYKKVTYVNVDQEIFMDVFEGMNKDIDLPSAKHSFIYDLKNRISFDPLLKFRDGNLLISKYQYGHGNVYLSAVPLDINYSNLPVHAIFAPMLYRIAISVNITPKLSYTIGEDKVIEVENTLTKNESVFRIQGKGFEFIPAQRKISNKVLLSFHDQISESGVYNLFTNENANPNLLAFNYNRKESELNFFNIKELEEKANELQINIISKLVDNEDEFKGEITKGVILWKLCIIFALSFIGIEGLLLRFL